MGEGGGGSTEVELVVVVDSVACWPCEIVAADQTCCLIQSRYSETLTGQL